MPTTIPGFATLFSLEGRHAVVAGASGAIGAHCARVLHAAGATVVLAARRTEQVSRVAAELGDKAAGIALDVADVASVEAALDAAAERFGVVDLVVNSVGVAVTRPVLQQTAADWDLVLDTNLRGAFLLATSAARRMVAAGSGGSIVNISSILGEAVIPGVAPYAASKAGLLHLTRSMALELARHRIRVNALAPGYLASEINDGFFSSDPGRALIRRIPQRRLGEVGDLTGPLLLLASEAGAHMTGTVVGVDGGHALNALNG